MEYTKGNWHLDCNEGSNQYPCHIANVNHCTSEVEANAHLIAAAPAMYKALKLAISKLENEGRTYEATIWICEKALAKAEGVKNEK